MGILDALGIAGAERAAHDVEARPTSDVDRTSWTDRHILEEVLGKLDGLPSAMRQALADHLWADIPRTVFEYGWLPSAQQVSAAPQTNGLRRITSVYTLAPTGQGATIKFGNGALQIPVPAGYFFFGPINAVLAEGEIATLVSGVFGGTQAAAGPIFLGLFGEQLNAWSQID